MIHDSKLKAYLVVVAKLKVYAAQQQRMRFCPDGDCQLAESLAV
jgi:hypothetical protein